MIKSALGRLSPRCRPHPVRMAGWMPDGRTGAPPGPIPEPTGENP